MSVVFDKVVKSFHQRHVVDSVSFELKPDEVTGLLGPNGAGKSTVMKMMAGVLLPDMGKITVCGYDVARESIPAKRCVGYLPENNPLYEDMYPREYLKMAGRLAGLRGKQLSEKTTEVIDLVGLGTEARKKIYTLSKGYKQRIGFAQALIADPKVLILDEPSEGFDPNQLTEIRKVIRSLAKHKTILLSTHIMQEVEALCDRILLIDRGKIISDTTMEAFKHTDTSLLRLLIKFKSALPPAFPANIPGILKIIVQDPQTLIVEADPKNDPRPHIFKAGSEIGLMIAEVRELKSTPEEVFRHLTETAKDIPQV